MKFFEKEVNTIEELKAEYFSSAKENHPDHGGSVEIMKKLSAEYARLHKLLEDIHTGQDGKSYKAYISDEVPTDFIDIISKLLAIDGLMHLFSILAAYYSPPFSACSLCKTFLHQI